MSHTSDFVVVGGGVFGVWIAWFLRQRKYTVTLVDAYGAGNSRSSSGDESRVIRMAYGADALYTRWAAHSLRLWQELFARVGVSLFVNTGMLWLAADGDVSAKQSVGVLSEEGVEHEVISERQIAERFPQFSLDDVKFGIFEPNSGILMARRSVVAVLDDAVRQGVQYRIDAISPPAPAAFSELKTAHGETLSAGAYIFACGAWLNKLFPELLSTRLFPTRQAVFYFGTPAGHAEFQVPRMPTWLHRCDDMYGMPDIENRGIKLANDLHGPPVDPDSENRLVSQAEELQARNYLRRRLPALKDAPVLETRICQYENTWNGDFLLDRHPEWNNVWLAGGGSGHGYKHGPAIGDYLSKQILQEAPPEPRFSLASKKEIQQRAIF
ncbi:MAG: FAD-dependent oxidoreductase [Acidobacteria bacterium]|nr:FAD-dependent oxidoreductase [Acidobacteriota bacterium]